MSSGSTTLQTARRPKLRRTVTLLSVGLFAVGVAILAPTPANALPVTTLVSSALTVTAPGQTTLTANGFAAGEALAFTLDSAPLPTYGQVSENADSSGHYDGVAVIPGGTTLGAHTITVTGTSSLPASTVINVVATPTSAVSPSTVALSAYLSNGVTATFSGFAPGSTVSFGISTQSMGDPAGPDVVVAASGIATIHFVPKAGSGFANAGTYNLMASSAAYSILSASVSFTVTANPVVAPPVADPATPVKKVASFTG